MKHVLITLSIVKFAIVACVGAFIFSMPVTQASDEISPAVYKKIVDSSEKESSPLITLVRL